MLARWILSIFNAINVVARKMMTYRDAVFMLFRTLIWCYKVGFTPGKLRKAFSRKHSMMTRFHVFIDKLASIPIKPNIWSYFSNDFENRRWEKGQFEGFSNFQMKKRASGWIISLIISSYFVSVRLGICLLIKVQILPTCRAEIIRLANNRDPCLNCRCICV